MRRVLRVLGRVGAILFVATLIGLYVAGGRVQADDVTPQTLTDRWTTRLIEHDGRTALRLYAWFDASPDEVWQFVLDYEQYPDRIPYLKSGRTLGKRGDEAELELVTRAFPVDIRERIRMRYEGSGDRRTAVWSQIEGTLEHNDGRWEVERSGNRTFLRYTMCLSYGRWVPDWLLYGVLRANAGVILKAIDGRIAAGRSPKP